MPFKSAYLKLTFFYVLIIMLVSICFSIVLFQVSSGELDRGLRRQGRMFQELPRPELSPNNLFNFEEVRLKQLEESSRHLLLNLIYFNLLILFLSAGISYWLARYTLKPIKEMVEIQNRFTADASHELRTPLTAMKTEIEVLLRSKKLNQTETKKLLQSNLEEIGKLESLSNGLLKLANFEHKQLSTFKVNRLKEIINEAFNKVKAQAKKQQIKFSFKIENLKIKSDKQSLIDTFAIFLDNAVKYSPSGKKVFVSAKKIKHSILVKIKDQGVGIKTTDLPHIFDRFYRAEISRSKEKTGGFGLGLSIAKKIIEMHYGSIKVESKPGKGSTFTVILPRSI